MRKRLSMAVLGLAGLMVGPAYAQSSPSNPTQQRVPGDRDQVPVFRVTVVARTTPAINYRHRGGATKIDFRGTPLLPKARGEAKVESKQGYIEIEVEFDDLVPATKFGPEYLTYVMWAITPEGRATNLGEVLLNDSESKLNVTTELQAFGLVVTAEPYFAVSQPSDVVVMENVIRPDTQGKVEQVEAKYELLTRGTYLMNADPSRIAVRRLDRKTPLELYEARNALQLSEFAGADRYAPESFQKASRLLQQAEEYRERKSGRRSITMAAREAAQTAEDARLIAIQRRETERLERAQEAAADREAQATARAQTEARLREQAEADRTAAERRRIDAEAAAERAVRERTAAEAAADRAVRERTEAEVARSAAERAKDEAERAQQRLAEERAAAEAARDASKASEEDARQAVARAEIEKAELRERLQRQLNIILETKESARGLIVNVSDVLFDSGRHTLKPGAREKLARVAGILLTYPDLRLEVDGHTDSVGDDDYNQTLSERRAESVRTYLVQQGIPPGAIVSLGYGESQPVASNNLAAGRLQNRRVELIVAGESIGRPVPSSSSLRRPER
jgi:outer membrane protein OmpA-like peptidoglycan-associated protein